MNERVCDVLVLGLVNFLFQCAASMSFIYPPNVIMMTRSLVALYTIAVTWHTTDMTTSLLPRHNAGILGHEGKLPELATST